MLCGMLLFWLNWEDGSDISFNVSLKKTTCWKWLRTQSDFKISHYFSVCLSVCRLNSTIECIPYHLQLSPQNALQLIQQYPSTKPPHDIICNVGLFLWCKTPDLVFYTHACLYCASLSVMTPWLCFLHIWHGCWLFWQCPHPLSGERRLRAQRKAPGVSKCPEIGGTGNDARFCVYCSGFEALLYLTLCVCS